MNKTLDLESAVIKIERQFGPRAIMHNGAIRKILFPQVIPTGILQLDKALGISGIPRGRITDIYGMESAGKTTLCYTLIGEAQQIGLSAAFVEMGHELNLNYAIACGVDPDRLFISQPDNAENALNITEALVQAGINLVVFDSVAAMSPSYELKGKMGDNHEVYGKLMAQAMRKLTGLVNKNNTALIFTNQERIKQNVLYGDPFYSTGGSALKFFSSVRIRLSKIKPIRDRDEVVGQRIKAIVKKNNMAPPFREAEYSIVWGHQ